MAALGVVAIIFGIVVLALCAVIAVAVVAAAI